MKPLKIKEMSDSIDKTQNTIETLSNEVLKTDLEKMTKWRDTATDRLEKMVWSDLITLIKRELKRRGITDV